MFTNNPILKKKNFCGWGGGGGGGGGGGRGEQEGVLGKVNYFYKESKSNIKEKKMGGRGWGVGNDGWRGLELVIFFNYETKFKIK